MRPATIASMEVDGLKPSRLLVVALLTFVLTVSASVAVAASRVALMVGNGTYAHRPPPAAGFGVTVARAAQDPSAVEAELGLDRPTRRLIQQGLRNEGFDAGTPDGLFGPRTRAAIRAWQAAREQAETGYLDGVQAAALRAAASPPAAVASDPEAGTDQAAGSPGASEPQVATAAPPPAANGLAAPAGGESPPAPAAAVINPEDEDNAPAVQAARSTQLPPEILVDRRLLRVERLLAADNHQAAHDVMNEIFALEREHDVALPAEFPFRFAQVAFAAGLAETAVEHVNEYLLAAGRDGEFYRAALELLDTAEEAVRLAEAERRRAEAARQRAEEERRRAAARQRENDELARRQTEAAAVPLPRDPLRSGGLAPEMVSMPRGRFQYVPITGRSNLDVGREPRWVSIDRSLAIAKYEVTRAEFARFAERGRYRTEAERSQEDSVCDFRVNRRLRTWRQPGFSQTDAHPVVCVTIRDAMAYAEWLSQETGHTYRLPSAAEWQYAARAGSEEAMRHIQSDDRNNCGRGNLREYPDRVDRNPPGCVDGVERTAEVGRFPPNAVGLHDMIGNVGEFVLTCLNRIPNTDNYIERSDVAPDDPRTCDRTLAYGGTFGDYAWAWYGFSRAATSYPFAEQYVGFRVLRELDGDQPDVP